MVLYIYIILLIQLLAATVNKWCLIILVGAISLTVNIADYVYVLTLSDIMVFHYGTR